MTGFDEVTYETKEEKDAALLAIYKDQFKYIDDYINLSWQSIAILVLFGVLILFSYEFDIPLIVSSLIMITLCSWHIFRLYNTSLLCDYHEDVTSDIENYFLEKDDMKDIFSSLKRNKSCNSKLSWMNIQKFCLYALWVASIMFYIFQCDGEFINIHIDIGLLGLLIFSGTLFFFLNHYEKNEIQKRVEG